MLLIQVYRDLVNRESTVYGSGSKDHVAISSGSTQSTATRLLLDEQEKYHRSNRLIDNHLSAASTIRSALRAQRVALRNATSGLNSLTSRFPRIKQLVGKIEWRQRKDSIVLGFVIACCIAFLLIYKLSWSVFNRMSSSRYHCHRMLSGNKSLALVVWTVG